MQCSRDEMIDFLVGPVWPTSGAAGDPPRLARRRGRWLRAIVLVQVLLATGILGWLATGRPGLPEAAGLVGDAAAGWLSCGAAPGIPKPAPSALRSASQSTSLGRGEVQSAARPRTGAERSGVRWTH